MTCDARHRQTTTLWDSSIDAHHGRNRRREAAYRMISDAFSESMFQSLAGKAIVHSCTFKQPLAVFRSVSTFLNPLHMQLLLSGAYVTPAAAANPNSVCMAAQDAEFEQFCNHANSGANIVPLYQRIFSDQLTPVLAYRCLVEHNDIQSPSFLLESVVNGDQQGRYSFVGAMPALEVVAKVGTGLWVSIAEPAGSVKSYTKQQWPEHQYKQQKLSRDRCASTEWCLQL